MTDTRSSSGSHPFHLVFPRSKLKLHENSYFVRTALPASGTRCPTRCFTMHALTTAPYPTDSRCDSRTLNPRSIKSCWTLTALRQLFNKLLDYPDSSWTIKNDYSIPKHPTLSNKQGRLCGWPTWFIGWTILFAIPLRPLWYHRPICCSYSSIGIDGLVWCNS